MRRVSLSLVLLLAFGFIATEADAKQAIAGLRMWNAPDHTRVVLDLSGPVSYRVFRLHRPERIVIDIKDAQWRIRSPIKMGEGPVVRAIRHGHFDKRYLRVVVDLKEKVTPRSFLLKPTHGKPHRLVLDLMRKQGREDAITADVLRKSRDIVIAIDAGHGGEDPGAIGPHGIREKDITLAVAKKLAAAIQRHKGLRAYLIRKGDYFIPLRKRVALARKAKADLLISIHADSIRNRNVQGASVYTLSEKGASDHIAAMLAKKENAADAIGGVIPDEVDDPMVNRILADLIKRNTLNSSQLLAEHLLRAIGHVGPIKYRRPKKARFVVLGAPEIPSVLVELDYISNPRRERILASSKHQKKLAYAMLDASLAFLRKQGRISDDRYYIVKKGDSLWSIARRYDTTIKALMAANDLKKGQHLQVGAKLRVPQS